MSDETNNTEAAKPEAGQETPKAETANAETSEPKATEAKEEHQVPVSALTKEREKAASKIEELESKLEEINKKEEERKRAELDEVERAKLEAEEAKAATKQLQDQLKIEQRTRVALAAASKEGFADPEDALRFVDLGSLSSDEDIQEAVSGVLNEKPYLKAEEPKGPSQTSGVEDGKESAQSDTPESAHASILQDAAKFLPRR